MADRDGRPEGERGGVDEIGKVTCGKPFLLVNAFDCTCFVTFSPVFCLHFSNVSRQANVYKFYPVMISPKSIDLEII